MAIRASHSRRTGLFQRGSKKIAEPCLGSGPAREPGADGRRAMRAAPREPALRPRPCQGGLFSGAARRWPPAAAPVRALARGCRGRGGAAGRPGRLDASRGLEAAPHSAGGGLAAPVLEHSLRNAVLFGGTRTRYRCINSALLYRMSHKQFAWQDLNLRLHLRKKCALSILSYQQNLNTITSGIRRAYRPLCAARRFANRAPHRAAGLVARCGSCKLAAAIQVLSSVQAACQRRLQAAKKPFNSLK